MVEVAYRKDSVLVQLSRDNFSSRFDRISYSASKGNKRSSFGNWGKNKKAKSSSESSSGLYSNDGSSSTGSFSSPCFACGQQGHMARTCPNNPRVHRGGCSREKGSTTSRGSGRGRNGNRG